VRALTNLLMVVAAILVVGGAVYVVMNNHAPEDAGNTIASRTPAAPRSPPDAPRPAPTKHPKPTVVAFVGDDWTAGTGASSNAKRFTTLVSKSLGFTERNFGADGTGYAKTSSDAGDFASRVRDVAAAHPDIVVVSGGRNDNTNSLDTVSSRTHALFDALHEQLPHATLVAITPWWGDSDTPTQVTAIGQAVKQAVTSVGGSYLDIPDPIHHHPGFMADAADPDDDGYAAIAAAIEPKLKRLLD